MMDQQPPVQVPGSAMLTYPAHHNRAGKKIGIIVGIVIIVLLAIGAGVWAWMTYSDKSPDVVLAMMMEKSKSIDSYAMSGAVNGELLDTSGNNMGHTTIDINDHVAGSDSSNGKEQSTTDMIITTPNSTDEIAIEQRFVDSLLYFQFTKLPSAIGDLAQVITNSEANIMNQWYVLDKNEVTPYLMELKKSPGVTDEDQKSIQAFVDGLSIVGGVKLEDEITAIAQKHDLIHVKNVLPQEVVDGQKMYHYEMEIDETSYNNMTGAQLSAMENDIHELLAPMQISAEIWIGKKDYFLHKIKFDMTFDATAYHGTLPISTDAVGSVIVSADININDFNQSFDVVKPDNATSVVQMIRDFGENAAMMFGEKPKIDDNAAMMSDGSSVDMSIDTDNDGLTDYEETNIYHTDVTNPDTDGDRYTDGEEVKNGYDPNGPGKLGETSNSTL